MLKQFIVDGRIEAGCDEAGRGPLAGPVCAAAVILPPHFSNELINDSKKLNELSIPGTHDSGTYLASPGGSKCQNFDAKGQLAHGIRFFDVRLDNQLEICHGIDHFDVHFDDMLEDFGYTTGYDNWRK